MRRRDENKDWHGFRGGERIKELKVADEKKIDKIIRQEMFKHHTAGVVSRQNLDLEYGIDFTRQHLIRMERSGEFPESFQLKRTRNARRVYYRSHVEMWMRARELGIPWWMWKEKMDRINEIYEGYLYDEALNEIAKAKGLEDIGAAERYLEQQQKQCRGDYKALSRHEENVKDHDYYTLWHALNPDREKPE